ncbi:unnamed protein product, partial [Owenia fusiformis]
MKDLRFDGWNESTTVDDSVNNSTEVLQNLESVTLEPFAIFMITLSCLLSLLICGGNVPVILSIISFKILRTANNMFLMSLAVSDLCIGMVVLPLYTIDRYMTPLVFGVIRNEYICIFKHYFNICLLGASLFTMGGIALDRFISVTRPLKYKKIVTRSRVLLFITFCWLYPVVISSFMFYKRIVPFDEFIDKCVHQLFNRGYMIFANVNIVVLFLVIFVSNIIVAIVAVKQRSKHIHTLSV